MKKTLSIAFTILFALLSCDREEEGNPVPKELNASDGSAVGCIHIEFEKGDNVNTVILERREKGSGSWQVITGTGFTSFDDNQGYFNTGMPPGKVFEYRIKNDWPDDAEYSEIDEGYAYDIIPVTEIEITSSLQGNDETLNELRWNEHNNGSFINQSEILFDIYRGEDSLGTYQKIATVGEDRAYTDHLSAPFTGKKVYYRVDVYYSFEVNLASGGNHWESTTPIPGSVVSTATDTGGNPTADYSITDLGQVLASTRGGITQLSGKNINGTLYIGAINDAGATGYGKPVLYSLNGTNWQNEWNANLPNEFDRINYAVASGNHYVAGIQDSLCVYQWNGSSWTSNLAPDNLGQDDSPSSVSIECLNNDLYMAITQHPDYQLQVLKLNGSSWDTTGGDANGIIASGSIFNVSLENISGTLYLYYNTDNSTFIQHLNGSSWATDLAWTNEHSGIFSLTKSGNSLFFTGETSAIPDPGAIYKVSSADLAEVFISNEAGEWFYTPYDMTSDTDGNLIICSMKFESVDLMYPFLSLFDGNQWKTISGDFTDGITPVSLNTINNDIYYIYGDATTENEFGDPASIKAMKLIK